MAAQGHSNRISSGSVYSTNWGFPSLWSPTSSNQFCNRCGRDTYGQGCGCSGRRYGDDPWISQKRMFSVFGATDPVTGQTIGAAAFRDSTLTFNDFGGMAESGPASLSIRERVLHDRIPFDDENDYEMMQSPRLADRGAHDVTPSSAFGVAIDRDAGAPPVNMLRVSADQMSHSSDRNVRDSISTDMSEKDYDERMYDSPMGLLRDGPKRKSRISRMLLKRRTAAGWGAGNASRFPPVRNPPSHISRNFSKRSLRQTSQQVPDMPIVPEPIYESGPKKAHAKVNETLSRTLSAKSVRSTRGPPPKDPDLILWDGPQDPENPLNWSRTRKWASTIALGCLCFCVTCASSVMSSASANIAAQFKSTYEIATLATALFVAGFAFGPVLWGPFSELYGRKIPMFIGFSCFIIFHIPVSLANTLGTILACRFIAGFFGAAPLVIVGGALADFWTPLERGVAMSIFSLATFLGPSGGPVIGSYLTEAPGLGWTWTSWIIVILSTIFGLAAWIIYPESFGPVILSNKARRIRFATHNWACHAPMDEVEINLKEIAQKYISKPMLMLVYEPILFLITVYMSFIYGILYLCLQAFPISYILQRKWSLTSGSLPFLLVMVGVVIAGIINLVFTKKRWARISREQGRLPPEERLLPMIIGSVILPAGLFMFGWTSNPNLTAFPQIVAGIPLGLGICLIFLQGINYIVDVYMMYSASALAGNTFVRSLVGAIFPLFATEMYSALGVVWATSVLGFIAIALIPVPILFFKFGPKIRKISRYAPKFPPGGPGGPGGPPGMGGMGGPPPNMGGLPSGLGGGPSHR